MLCRLWCTLAGGRTPLAAGLGGVAGRGRPRRQYCCIRRAAWPGLLGRVGAPNEKKPNCVRRLPWRRQRENKLYPLLGRFWPRAAPPREEGEKVKAWSRYLFYRWPAISRAIASYRQLSRPGEGRGGQGGGRAEGRAGGRRAEDRLWARSAPPLLGDPWKIDPAENG